MRECSIGGSGGETTRGWVAPSSSHMTGYPGGLKFPGRKQDIILNNGNEIGGTPALLLPDDKGRRRGGENPAGGARGGWRCEGGRDIFLLRSQEVLNTFNFAASI